jgi:hypothetical protein
MPQISQFLFVMPSNSKDHGRPGASPLRREEQARSPRADIHDGRDSKGTMQSPANQTRYCCQWGLLEARMISEISPLSSKLLKQSFLRYANSLKTPSAFCKFPALISRGGVRAAVCESPQHFPRQVVSWPCTFLPAEQRKTRIPRIPAVPRRHRAEGREVQCLPAKSRK